MGQYVSEGSFVSAPFTASATSTFNGFTANITAPNQTTASLQLGVANQVGGSCALATYTFIGPDANNYAGSYFTPVGDVINAAVPLTTVSSYVNPARCFKYKAFFSTLDNTVTPSLLDITVNYAP